MARAGNASRGEPPHATGSGGNWAPRRGPGRDTGSADAHAVTACAVHAVPAYTHCAANTRHHAATCTAIGRNTVSLCSMSPYAASNVILSSSSVNTVRLCRNTVSLCSTVMLSRSSNAVSLCSTMNLCINVHLLSTASLRSACAALLSPATTPEGHCQAGALVRGMQQHGFSISTPRQTNAQLFHS